MDLVDDGVKRSGRRAGTFGDFQNFRPQTGPSRDLEIAVTGSHRTQEFLLDQAERALLRFQYVDEVLDAI